MRGIVYTGYIHEWRYQNILIAEVFSTVLHFERHKHLRT